MKRHTCVSLLLFLALSIPLTGMLNAQTVNCTGVPSWDGNFVPYTVGQLVTFNTPPLQEFKVIQSHTSEPNWEPPNVPALFSLVGTCANVATDPGVQAGNRGTGATIINPNNDPNGFTAFFNDGLARFQAVESVANSPNGNNGLGPRFNFNQCSGCHAAPAVGGTSPATNPEFTGFGGSCASVSNLSQTATVVAAGQPNAAQHGTVVCSSDNTLPSFVTANGPILEVRFPFFFNPNGTVNTSAPNGGVEDLFTVGGRPDGAGNCNPGQPPFSQAQNTNNIIFRIPTPTFGAGLIENLDDSTLLQNQAANNNNSLGISGTFNHNGNDGTITRFGWKAQNKSLHIFSGEAYNVEMGISNELFTQDRPLPEEENASGLPSNCLNLSTTGYPEDTSNPNQTTNAAVLDDVSAFSNFMRFLAPPPTGSVVLNGQTVSASTISAGQSLFSSVGCATCHNPSPGHTQVSNFVPALSNVQVNSYSDIAIHHMGTLLADNVSQGNAGGDQFRSAPLWGVGQRIFLLHDGRTSDLLQAIQDHSSNGSEANTVINNFNALTVTQQQEILDFVRSL